MTAQPLVQLTDEELAVLVDGASYVVPPYLDGIPAEHREIALRTAYRGLCARGWLEPAAVGATEAVAGVPVGLIPEVAELLRLRVTADLVVCAHRTSGDGEDFRYWHASDDVVLEERVSPLGMHGFWLLEPATLADDLVAYVLDPAAAGEPGPERELDPVAVASGHAPDDLVLRLARARLVADVVVRRTGDKGPGEMMGVLSGPGGVHVASSRFGSAAPVRIRSVTPGEVASLMAVLVRCATPGP